MSKDDKQQHYVVYLAVILNVQNCWRRNIRGLDLGKVQ